MLKRRKFLTNTLGTAVSIGLSGIAECTAQETVKSRKPVLISTWDHGIQSNVAGWEALQENGNALDAVEKGVMIVEADPKGASVGIGGRPDREGNVTLDACIMDHNGDCGSVCFLKDIKHPIAVARKVMENTPHVMLAGQGALDFALEAGFTAENLLTEDSERAWRKWLEKSQYEPIINRENHDTIGMLALDADGNLSGSCTTSGLAFKMHGRVGDSPIIGAGLYVDNEIGAACATGLGEEVIKKCASFLVVELMRQGLSPEAACKQAIERIVGNRKKIDFQVGLLAVNKQGVTGAYAIHKGFTYAEMDQNENVLLRSKYVM